MHAAIRVLLNKPAGNIDGYTEIRALPSNLRNIALDCLETAALKHQLDPTVALDPQAVFQNLEAALKDAKLEEPKFPTALAELNEAAPYTEFGDSIYEYTGKTFSFSPEHLGVLCATFEAAQQDSMNKDYQDFLQNNMVHYPHVDFVAEALRCFDLFHNMPKWLRTAARKNPVGSISAAVDAAMTIASVSPFGEPGRTAEWHDKRLQRRIFRASSSDPQPADQSARNSRSSSGAPRCSNGAHTNEYAASLVASSKPNASPRTSAGAPSARVSGGAPRSLDGLSRAAPPSRAALERLLLDILKRAAK